MRAVKLGIALFLLASLAFAANVPQVDIPFQKFTLKNGLTLIVHEDHKAPIVAINVWYHVGSKNEREGKTGFAHLFEHLMFNGSEHFNTDYFKALEKVGATNLNGTTNNDRTNYFQNVPTSAVDMVLWLESDRMGHLLGAIDQAKLDEQRGVVQNEKRQGENQPYAVSQELITKAVYPAGHPYAHTVIGSMEDLNAASLNDVKEWFKTYYGPSNATIVIAGDIDSATAKQKVEKYFGDIPPGPPVARFESWVAKRSGTQVQVAQDRVPQARLYKVWNAPGYGTADNMYLELLSDVLVSDKASRLYKRLVYDDQIATDVGASVPHREIGALFTITATAKPGDDLTKVRKAVDEELSRLLMEGPTQDELDRVRTQFFARFVRGAERIGGFGGKSDILAQSQVFGGSPDAYKKLLTWAANATTADLQRAGRQWLGDGLYELEVVPFPKFAAETAGADRAKMPEPSAPPAPKFAQVQRAKLSNGLQLVVAERHTVPIVDVSLLVDAGYASDSLALPGTASLAMRMLDEGTTTRDGLQISTDLSRLGAQLSTFSTVDSSIVNLSALKTTLDPSLDLYADVILNPAFNPADFARRQKLLLATIQREKATPVQMALRVLPRFIYGANHPYGNPFTGSGTEASVAKITRDDLIKFHRTWFKPNNATLVVVGDTTMAEIRPKLEKLFAGWKSGDVPKKNIAKVAVNDRPAVYLIDKPGALQSVLIAGVVGPPKANPNEIAIETMNTVFGGAFVSRLNMNLREDKHWSYGARSFLPDARGQRMFIAYAAVQTDKTKESLVEMNKELHDITTGRPVTTDELTMAKGNLTQSLPGQWETAEDVAGALLDIVQFNLPADYYDTYAGKVTAMTLDNMKNAAQEVVRGNNLVWIVVGDRAKVESGVRALNLGELHFIDADGNEVAK
jgi:zinc protease